MKLSRVLRISRPRFWIYELGPYMIGVLAGLYNIINLILNKNIFDEKVISQIVPKFYSTIEAFANHSISSLYIDYISIAIFGIYFLIMSNIRIYGINDIYDYETDKLNPKKLAGYEALVEPKEQKNLRKRISLTTIPFLLYALWIRIDSGYSGSSSIPAMHEIRFLLGDNILHRVIPVAFLAFLFFSGQYSAKPIRAKARPILDSFFSAGHYIATAVFGYLLVNPTGDINRYYVIAGMARAMAMHAFSAVPDIQADKDAKLATIATLLGGKATIRACFGLYLLASILSYSFLGRVSIVLGVVYCGLMIGAAMLYGNEKKVFALYKWFPWINTVSGMILFFVVLLKII